MTNGRWPALPYAEWRDTAATLHMWTQIVGKVRLANSPWVNHSWHVTLYVTPRGLGTGTIPHGERSFQIDFDFLDHRLIVATCDGKRRDLPLRPQATADFYRDLIGALAEVDVPTRIHGRPNEIPNPIPFAEDRVHASYDADAANRFWRALIQVDRLFGAFRAGFRGKCSPVHFFWGSFDLAVTRFSGRTAPPHPGGIPNLPDRVTREAYSQEVSSAGFWPGNDEFPDPIVYSYAYPAPPGFEGSPVRPAAATWHPVLREFVLSYDAVRTAPDPDATLMAFLESTYEAAAAAARWDRVALEMREHP